VDKKRNSIALITTHNTNNYGASLQCYATIRELKQYGDVSVINYDNRHIGSSMDLLRFSLSLRGIRSLAKDLLRILPRRVAIERFQTFAKHNFNLTNKFKEAELSGIKLNYDYYISGSDQIWNPYCISKAGKFDPNYFLEFAPETSVCASYASSWGGFQITPNHYQTLKGYLKKYKYISVRERQMCEELADLSECSIKSVCDPTLLLSKDEWIRVARHSTATFGFEDYLLVYSVPKNPIIKNVVLKIAERLKLQIVVLDQDPLFNIKGSEKIANAGPLEFVKLFQDASYVVTDSFHGTCFSTIFNKPFHVVAEAPHSSRIESFLNEIGLTSRLIANPDSLQNCTYSLDYGSANHQIDIIRHNSKQFIAQIFKHANN